MAYYHARVYDDVQAGGGRRAAAHQEHRRGGARSAGCLVSNHLTAGGAEASDGGSKGSEEAEGAEEEAALDYLTSPGMMATGESSMEGSSEKGFDYNSVKPRIVLEDDPIDYFNSPPKEVKVEEFSPVRETVETPEQSKGQVDSSSSAKSPEKEEELDEWLPELRQRGEEQRRQCRRILALCRARRLEAEEGEERRRLGGVLASFVASGESELTFPSSLAALGRQAVHEWCEVLGLGHRSHGAGGGRVVVVTRSVVARDVELLHLAASYMTRVACGEAEASMAARL